MKYVRVGNNVDISRNKGKELRLKVLSTFKDSTGIIMPVLGCSYCFFNDIESPELCEARSYLKLDFNEYLARG